MTSNFQKIGDYISTIDNRNSDGSITRLMGISIDKCYIPSVANVIGTDLKNYKIIRKDQFACSLMQVSRDQRIPIAMYEDDVPAIMSPAYVMFEVSRPDELLPEYMELWFMRAEFDREASFYAVGGVRGSLDWEDFCKMELPVPPLSEQRKIVRDYQVITDRIGVLRKMNGLQEELIKTLYRKAKSVPESKRATITVSDFCKVFTGKKDVNQAIANGKNRFYSCSPIPARSNDAIHEGRAILVAGNGSYTGRTMFVDEAFDLYQRTYALTPINKNCIELFLIYAALQTDFQEQIESKLHGSAIPYIVFGDLADFSFSINEDYQFVGESIKTLVYRAIKNNLEIEQLSSLKSLMLSSLVSTKKDGGRI